MAGLLVWRRLKSFVPPTNILFNVNNDTNLRALDIFLRTPRAANDLCVFLNCNNSVSPPLIAMVIKTMIDSRCCHISFTHISSTLPDRVPVRFPKTPYPSSSNLETFWVDSHLAFSRSLISFTIGILRYSPLKDLSLRSTGLGRTMWSKLLSSLAFPQLANLELDCACPIKTILDFLRRHPTLRKLTLHGSGNVTQKHVSRYSSIHLPSLSHLAGPPAYVSALAKHLQNTGAVRSLGVTLAAAHATPSLISQVLNTTSHFENLTRLEITFRSSESVTEESLQFPEHERRVSRVTDLEIARDWDIGTVVASPVVSYYRYPIISKLISHQPRCGTWLPAFPAARNVKLISNGLENEQQLRQEFLKHAPPHQPIFLKVLCF